MSLLYLYHNDKFNKNFYFYDEISEQISNEVQC